MPIIIRMGSHLTRSGAVVIKFGCVGCGAPCSVGGSELVMGLDQKEQEWLFWDLQSFSSSSLVPRDSHCSDILRLLIISTLVTSWWDWLCKHPGFTPVWMLGQSPYPPCSALNHVGKMSVKAECLSKRAAEHEGTRWWCKGWCFWGSWGRLWAQAWVSWLISRVVKYVKHAVRWGVIDCSMIRISTCFRPPSIFPPAGGKSSLRWPAGGWGIVWPHSAAIWGWSLLQGKMYTITTWQSSSPCVLPLRAHNHVCCSNTRPI